MHISSLIDLLKTLPSDSEIISLGASKNSGIELGPVNTILFDIDSKVLELTHHGDSNGYMERTKKYRGKNIAGISI